MDGRTSPGPGWTVAFIVDGMNVIGSRPDGWWRDRAAARRRLVEELAPLQGAGMEITVVFDGRETAGESDRAAVSGVTVSFAPGGPNAADDAIVALVGGLAQPADTVVVDLGSGPGGTGPTAGSHGGERQGLPVASVRSGVIGQR